ncbi:MAG: hypothetical protein JO041_06425 [Acidobacteria bacterium]|nr:hypothetical protein [Acidobacteriota bacterium]
MQIPVLKRAVAALFVAVVVSLASRPAMAIPAFARKYGLPCSACHEAWPKLNNFGQTFRDNGYQLGNDRDAPIYQNPSYFPSTVRITPQWHMENSGRTAVDAVPGNASSGLVESRNIRSSGFDLSGFDLWTAGTVSKNISFLVLPSADATAAFHFESFWVRFDNLLGTHWLNLKVGKHELDLPVSEKRELTLSNDGANYQVYHFAPGNPLLPLGNGQVNGFGLGNNQLGLELSGHSHNSYTRYAFSLVSNTDGQPNLPSSSGYDFYAHLSQAVELPHMGLQRFGVLGFRGVVPTYFQTANGAVISGSGAGDRSFYRAGAYGIWYLGKFDLSTVFMHGQDSAFLATGTPSTQVLPAGGRSATWNGGFAELHYNPNPQLVLVGRYELIRMAQQGFPLGTLLTNNHPLFARFGNIDNYVLGYRWYPIMISRGGLAWHQEYSWLRSLGTAPLSGLNVAGSSYMMGFDVAF